ncbi:MAG: transcription termination factor NusA [Capsulimonadaceae bacterium]
MNAEIINALKQLEKEKEIPFEILLKTLEVALGKAYKKHYGIPGDVIVKIDQTKHAIKYTCEKVVVETVVNEHAEMSLVQARKINPMATIGDQIAVAVTPENFGRIAAQTARQVMMQEFRETERDRIFNEYNTCVGEVRTGVVQRHDNGNVYINLGKHEALLPLQEQVPTEPYRFNDRIKVYLLEVRQLNRGPQIIVSRSHPSLIRRLFELEVPEIADGTVVIKSVAREAGARSKIAVMSDDDKIDPVGACVGHRGARVQAVVSELYDEKIDIVRWNPNVQQFVAESLSPAKSVHVRVNEEKKSCFVLVPDNMLSLAIGKSGQNVRLAARLTGWRIDIRSESQEAKAAFAKAAEEVELEDRARIVAAGGRVEGEAALPTDESGRAVSYGDEVMITADMLRNLNFDNDDD